MASDKYYLFQNQPVTSGLIHEFETARDLYDWLNIKLNDKSSGLDIDKVTIICGQKVDVKIVKIIKSVKLNIPALGTDKCILIKDKT